jgi:hypothetical protein
LYAIYPTGPIGRAKEYEARYGVGWLACVVPDVPIVPVTVQGLQEARLFDILRLRRPLLRVRVGKPFRGRALSGDNRTREREACDRVKAEWTRLEEGPA